MLNLFFLTQFQPHYNIITLNRSIMLQGYCVWIVLAQVLMILYPSILVHACKET